MNQRANAAASIADVQAIPDAREIAIDQVGIKGVQFPLTVRDGPDVQSSVGTWNMTVRLPKERKGTHMSRFVALLEEHRVPLDAASFACMVRNMLLLLDADAGRIEVTFPYFINKIAPVSKVMSLMNYEVGVTGQIGPGGLELTVRVVVPVTSLCPCSKEISAYGAHNQRSHITVDAVWRGPFALNALIARIEAQASCELYGLLKRPDEKYVTERAYENPKFVEDLVRDVALMLDADPQVAAYELSAENFESIHNHSAYARLSRDKRT